jgi:hypothetical protein
LVYVLLISRLLLLLLLLLLLQSRMNIGEHSGDSARAELCGVSTATLRGLLVCVIPVCTHFPRLWAAHWFAVAV